MMSKYNKSEIMSNAWARFRNNARLVERFRKTFSECLKLAWKIAKEAVKAAEEAAAKGIVRMKYAEYKTSYSWCKTVEGSYDKSTKTIEVMTKVSRYPRAALGLCPRCHTYCCGDCGM